MKDTIPVTFSSGVSCELDYDDLVDFSERSSELVKEACDLRNSLREAQASQVFSERGLIQYNVGDVRSTKMCWALPEGFGKLPYGVPILSYSPINAYSRRFAQRNPHESEMWSLTLTNMGYRAIAVASYDDVEGQHKLVDMLQENDPETLGVQLALMSAQAVTPQGSYSKKILDEIQRLFRLFEDMPALPDAVYDRLAQIPAVQVSRVGMIEPNLCRIVHIPQMLHVHMPHGSYVSELDKVLREVGAIGLANRGGLSWGGTERFGTVRGYGKKIGTISGDLNKALAITPLHPENTEDAPPANVLSFAPNNKNYNYYGSAGYAVGYTVDMAALSLMERSKLLAL